MEHRGGSRAAGTDSTEVWESVIFCDRVICLKFVWFPVPAPCKMCIQTKQYKI